MMMRKKWRNVLTRYFSKADIQWARRDGHGKMFTIQARRTWLLSCQYWEGQRQEDPNGSLAGQSSQNGDFRAQWESQSQSRWWGMIEEDTRHQLLSSTYSHVLAYFTHVNMHTHIHTKMHNEDKCSPWIRALKVQVKNPSGWLLPKNKAKMCVVKDEATVTVKKSTVYQILKKIKTRAGPGDTHL